MDIFSIRRRSGALQTQFWLASGITDSDVMAVYQFKNAKTESDALKDMSGNGYSLSKSENASWSSSGFSLNNNNYLNNNTLKSNSASIVMKISSGSAKYACILGSCGGRGLWLSTPFLTQSFAYHDSGTFGVTNENGLSTAYEYGTLALNKVRIASSFYASGVIGYTYSGNNAYKDGSAISLSNAAYDGYTWSGFIADTVPRLVGGYVNPDANTTDQNRWNYLGKQSFSGSFRVEYLAVYSKSLSASQHAAIAQNMADMG